MIPHHIADRSLKFGSRFCMIIGYPMPNIVRIDVWDLRQFLGCSTVSTRAISVTIST
jgi:hypothetical protein